MARTVRNTKVVKFVNDKFYKNYSNKVIRNYKGAIADGSSFKKIISSYDICDLRTYIG